MANGPGNPSSIKDLLNRYNQTISASAPKELDPWGMEQVDPDTVLMPGGVYTPPDETREQEQWEKDWQNKNVLQKAGAGIKKGYLSMKGGIENFAAETLPKIAGATSGIITPGGYNPMASEVVKQGVVPLKEKALTSIQQAEDIKGEGFYFQAGQFIPQVVGSVAALAAAPFTGGTSLSVIPGLIGIANIGLITSSVVGNTLAEIDQYAAEKNKPINESTKWAVALTAGAIEFAAEKIRLDRFIPKGLTSKMLTGILKETPEAAEDMLKQWAKSNPSMYKKLLEFIKVTTQNGFEEGSEEFLTQFVQDYANYIYQDKEDRLGLKEILGNSFEAAKGGFMMGGFIGPMSYASNQLTTKMRRERQGGMTLVQTTEGNVLELVGADDKGNLFVQDNLGRSTQIKETDVKDRLSMTGDQMNQYIDAYEKGQDIAPQLEEQAKQNEVVNKINQYGQQLKFGDTPLEQDPNPVISFGNTKFGQKLILRNQQNTNGDDIFVAYDAVALKESQYDFEATKPIFVKATDVIERKDVPYDEWMNNELAEYESTMQQADNIAAAAESPFTPGQTINYKGKQWVISDITTNGLEVDEIGEDGLPGASTIIPQEEFNNIPEYAQQAQQQSGDQQPAGTMPGEQGQPAADKPQAREISDGKDKYTITPTDEEGSYSIDKVFYTEKQANTVMGKLQEYYPKLNFKLNVIDSGDDFTPDQYTISARSKKIRRAPRQEAQPEPVAEQQIDPATLPLKEFVQAELDKLPKGARPEYRGQVEIKAKETHKNAVANALQSGAQLPPEILSDYPELSTPLLAQPEPSTPDETAPVEQTTEMQNAGGMEAGEETGTSLSDEEEVLKWIEDKYPDYVAYEWDGKNLEVAFENQDKTVKRTRQDLLKEGVKLNTTQSESNNPAIDLAAANSQVETNPSDAQKEAGNYKHGHMSFNGMEISIENPAGSVRSGTDQNGNDWSVLMNNSYGYIRGTEGSDGDHLDVFMGDNLDSDKVYVIDQVNPETNDFDEHKVILGAVSRQDAIDTYQSNYDPSWKGLGNITELTMDDFKKWAYNKKRTQEPLFKEEKKKESKIKAGSRTSNVLAIEPGDFTEAVLHFFVAGGKVDRNDFIRHTGLKGKDLQQYNFLLSNDGAKLDVFHERLDNSFGMEDEGAMDMANEVIEIMTTFPSKAKMLKALEVRYNIGTGKEEMTDEQAAADYTPEVPIDEVAPGAVDAIINQAMGDQYLADILNTGEFTDEEGNTDWNKIKNMIEANEGYFKQFPFGLTDDELQNLKSIADENTKNQQGGTPAQSAVVNLGSESKGQEDITDGSPAGVEAGPQQEAEQQPVEQKQPTAPAPAYGETNTVFTADAAAKAREILRKKLGNLNVGIDPETMQAGIALAGYHIEAGARKFSAFAKAMVEDMGDAIKLYLKLFYNAVRDWPGFNNEGMDDYGTVSGMNVDDITKEEKPADEVEFEKHRIKFTRQGIEAEKMEPKPKKQPEFAGDLFSQPEPPKTRSIEFAGDWFNNTVAVDVESNNLSKEEKEIQNRFEKDLTENYQERKAEYLSKFGREISADNAKELSNDYRSNRTKFTEAVHEPSSKFAKRLFSELVAEEAPNGYDNSVRFSSGGTGAGKTTVLRFMSNLNSLKPSVTYDSNFNSLEGSKEKIDYALKNGKNIEVVFVYRDPVLSFTHGVIPRMNKIGRVIPLSTHIETHANSIENIKKLYDLYKGKIDFWLFDNSNSKGEIKRISPEELPKLIVNKKEATNELRNYIEDQRERGLLSQEQYSAIVGRYISEFNDGRDSETNGAGSQRNTEGSTDKQVNNQSHVPNTAGNSQRDSQQSETILPGNQKSVPGNRRESGSTGNESERRSDTTPQKSELSQGNIDSIATTPGTTSDNKVLQSDQQQADVFAGSFNGRGSSIFSTEGDNGINADESVFDAIENASMPNRIQKKGGSEGTPGSLNTESALAVTEYLLQKHSKTGAPLHTIKLVNRVPREIYLKLNDIATNLGGYFSTYSKQGMQPGFIFTTKEDADKFIERTNNNVNSLNEPKEEYKGQPLSGSQSEADGIEAGAGNVQRQEDTGKNPYRGLKGDTYDEVNRLVKRYQIKVFDLKEFNYWFNKFSVKGGVNPTLLAFQVYEQMPSSKGRRFKIDNQQVYDFLDDIADTEASKVRRQKEIRTRIEILSNELNTPVTIINDRSELPKHIQDDIKTYASDAKKIPGIYDPENDAVYLLINELYDVKEAIGVVLHEVVAHKGLAEIMGNDFNKLLNDIYNDMTEEEVSRFEIMYNTEDPQIIADEYIAFIAETGTEPNLFERFIAAVRQWFRQYFKVNYSKNEIKSLLSKSRKHLASKAKPTARDYETAGEYMEALTAWHGSPYNITKFSTKKIGTGEGNQMFGYGLYFTDKKDIAEFYARSNANMNDYLSEARNRIGDKGVAWIEKALARTKWDYPATMEYLKVQRDKFNQDPKIFNRFQRIIDYIGVNPFPENRYIYQVLMGKNKTPGQMDWLHYEKPLKNTQVVKIADQLQKEGINNATLEFALWNITPASKIYELLTKQFKSNKKASHFLSRAGIDGMTYPIGTFQQKEQPGRNYVVFNDRDVKINSKTRFKITTNEKGDNDPDDDGSGRPPFNILQSKSEKRVELFQNRMLSVREWQNRIRGKGGKITDLSNPYRQENLSHGIVKNAIESFDEKYLEKIEEAAAGIMEKAGLDYEQLNRYMMAKHAPERNREIAMRNLTKELELPVEVIKHMYDNGSLDKATVDRIDNSVNSGMTTKEANEIVENIEGKLTDRLINNFWKEVNRSTKFSVDRWMADGFISPETHAKISAMYKYYVPLRNWQKTELDEMYEYQSEDIGKTVNPLRSAKGRESLSDDPLQYIVNMAHSAIVMGEKNRVKLHAFRLVRDNKEMNDMHRMRTSYYVYTGKMDQYGNKIWEETFIKPAQEFWEQGNVKTKKDTSHFVRRPASLATQHEVDVFVGGERYTMVLPADVSNALNKVPSKYDDIAFILRDLKIGNIPVPIGNFTRWLSSNFTSKNPAFILMNQIRDLQYAALAHFIKGDAKEAAQFIKILPKARKAIIQHIKGKGNVKDKTYQAYMDFMINGGETGYIHMKDVDQLADDIKKDLSRLTGQNSMLDKTLHADLVRNMGKWLDHMAVRSENLSRFATYLVAKQQGKTNREAAFAAKEITVNFNRKGSISSFLGSLYAFFNAAVQGGDNIIRMGKEHKYKFMAIGATGIAFGFLEALFNNLWGGDDDDQNKYANASDYLKFNNFVLMIPGMEKYITVPLPHGFRWFHSLGVSAYQAISGEKSVGEAMKDAASNAFSSLSPVNPVEFIKDDGSFTIRPIVPTAAVPFYDIAINQTFTGAHVHKEPYTAALKGRIANTALGKDNVNSIVQTFTDFLFKVGGGDPETGSKYYMNDQGKIVPVSNIFDKNPSDIEHVIEYYLGGRGMFWNDVMKTSQNIMEMAKSLMEDESFTQAVTDVNMNEFPVLKSLVRQPWRKSVYSSYYDIVNDIENYKAMVRMKNKSIDTESEAPQEYTPDYQYKIELLSDLKKELRGLDEDMQDITDPEMIREIKQVQERLISNFIEATK